MQRLTVNEVCYHSCGLRFTVEEDFPGMPITTNTPFISLAMIVLVDFLSEQDTFACGLVEFEENDVVA